MDCMTFLGCLFGFGGVVLGLVSNSIKAVVIGAAILVLTFVNTFM